MLGVPGLASGEWIVAYNGPAGQTGNWQSQITAGEIVMFSTSSSGHITTVVSGSGSSAMVVDNMAFENGNGQITNSANDGAWDIIIGQPHAASYEWGLAVAGSAVVYELDCPVIKVVTPSSRVAIGDTEQLAPLFLATNPLASQAITEYQFYDNGTGGAANDSFSLNGANVFANSAANAFTVSAADLANLSLQAGNSAGADTISVRAFKWLLLGRLAEIHRQYHCTGPGRQRADADANVAGGTASRLCARDEYLHRPAGRSPEVQREPFERGGPSILAAIQRRDADLHRVGSVQHRRPQHRGDRDQYERAQHVGNLLRPDACADRDAMLR
jgi:hypothetical protein